MKVAFEICKNILSSEINVKPINNRRTASLKCAKKHIL